MTDDNVQDSGIKGQKNPREQALNKLRESALKELQKTVEEATKTTFDAKRVYTREREKLEEAVLALEEAKAEFNEFQKDI